MGADLLFLDSSTPGASSAIDSLERQLASFYDRNVNYYDCASESDKSHFFEPVAEIARSVAALKGHVRILEVGAGKSELPAYLRRGLGPDKLEFVAHDINATNRSFYQASGIPLFVGNISELATDEAFDIIVSFFVWEHLARPAQCLDKMCSLLRRDGRLIIVSPKYTFPLYIPPAIRHLSRSRQLRANARLVVDSLLTGIRRRPRFSVVIDPAVFHAPWRRDFDAIHMVSSADLTAHLGRAWRVGNLPVEYGSLKARLLASLMLLSVVICRR